MSMSLVEQAQVAFSGEKYEEAKKLALQSMDALAGLQEMDDERKRLEEEALAKAKKGVYPEYYIIHDWNKTKDCFWNIAAKPFVYNDPYKWEVLYEANRGVLDNASNPDIIQPEIKIRIPSLAGEVREGTYDPEQEYNVFEEK